LLEEEYNEKIARLEAQVMWVLMIVLTFLLNSCFESFNGHANGNSMWIVKFQVSYEWIEEHLSKTAYSLIHYKIDVSG